MTSTNREKLTAVEAAFGAAGKPVQVQGMKADSGIYHGQPWGMQHTFEGAQARLHDVKFRMKASGQFSGITYIASIENGIQVPVI